MVFRYTSNILGYSFHLPVYSHSNLFQQALNDAFSDPPHSSAWFGPVLGSLGRKLEVILLPRFLFNVGFLAWISKKILLASPCRFVMLSCLWGMMFHHLDPGSVLAQRGVMKYEFQQLFSRDSHEQFAKSLKKKEASCTCSKQRNNSSIVIVIINLSSTFQGNTLWWLRNQANFDVFETHTKSTSTHSHPVHWKTHADSSDRILSPFKTLSPPTILPLCSAKLRPVFGSKHPPCNNNLSSLQGYKFDRETLKCKQNLERSIGNELLPFEKKNVFGGVFHLWQL